MHCRILYSTWGKMTTKPKVQTATKHIDETGIKEKEIRNINMNVDKSFMFNSNRTTEGSVPRLTATQLHNHGC